MDGETRAPESRMVPLDELHPMVGNRVPRGLDELAEDIRRRGILNPIIVRPSEGDGYEIIAGERRWRAARLAGMERVPVSVRELDDLEAEETAAVDNLQREGLTPLEEAQVYDRLRQTHPSADEIARRVGRSATVVRQRLRLLDLIPDLRELVDAERLDLGAAELIAQTHETAQREIARELVRWRTKGERVTRQDVRHLVDRHIRELAEAPFDTSATDLPGGPCGACARRTGSQGALFDVLEREDVCLDEKCWRGKVDVVWLRRKTEAEAAGRKVLSDRKSAQVVSHGLAVYGSEFVAVETKLYIGAEEVPAGELVPDAPRVLARDPDSGVPVELLPKALVDAAERAARAAAAAKGKATTKAKGGDSSAAQRQKEQAEARARDELARAVQAVALANIVGAVGRLDGRKVALGLALLALEVADEHQLEPVARRRGVAAAEGERSRPWEAALAQEVQLAVAGEPSDELATRLALQMAVEALAAMRISGSPWTAQEVPNALVRAGWGLDADAWRTTAEEQLRAKKAPKKQAPKSGKAAKAAKSTKPAKKKGGR